MNFPKKIHEELDKNVYPSLPGGDGRNMTFSQVGMTRMMGQSMEIEDTVTQAVNTTARMSVNGDEALVYDKDGNIVMKLTRVVKK
ncbi:MAG: META domain-containing protein [Bacteroidales bacterium]|nr:META domain-containing protein [Bacteroidales bacterium]